MEQELLYEIHSIMAATAIGFCRIAPTFYLLPFFASGNIPAVVRHPVIILLSFALVQHFHYELLTLNKINIALIVSREILIGSLIGCLLASPFWIFLAIGSFIDNQRGATLSSTLDPATGVDTSELARLFNLFSASVYLTNGGMSFILETLWQSYTLWSPGDNCIPNLVPVLSLINNIMTHTIVYASPVIAVMLGGEAVLGLLSRYASQLNAFAISLTIKSALAFFILIVYFGPILAERVMPLSFYPEQLQRYFVK
ncbi:EscT/YscT/HrcT family type III secretion system export apparatus protein [Escherichia albertii]|uniref:type III secretion system export apparatus subunit SctT n=2 Tax=Escherichia albertii TaxID=208962 RepID=UPI0010F8FFC3|nr:type III secretion system export apparatus subunit SctT [Escherichia albertii]EFB1502926.1 EscT/YscT/HrcT family type III secretion system export apparatus protein [Escherichia albertii]MCU7271837.1 type III secretion system export apparatus subunit SctT [Escherichia albertii]